MKSVPRVRVVSVKAPAASAPWATAREVSDPAQESLSPLHEAALRQLREGRWADAAATLTDVLRATPRHATAWSDLGVATAAMGRAGPALECYGKALKIRPDHASALGNKGNALCGLGRPAEALACYDRALAIAPRAAEHHNNRGGALRALRRWPEALASFDRALALRPDFIHALSNRGATLNDLDLPLEALASFDKALHLDPRRADIYIERGLALSRLGREREALASQDRAIELNPGAPEAHNNRAEALRALGRHAEAMSALMRALWLNPNFPEAINNLGATLLDMRRPVEALSALDAALLLRPTFVAAIGNRANVLVELDRHSEALAACDRALALQPQDYTALVARGVALANLGRETEALADYDAAIAIRPAAEIAHNNKGLALAQLGRIAEGARLLQRASEMAPRNARIHYNLALAKRFTIGDPQIAALKALLAADSGLGAHERITAGFALAKALDDVGDRECAMGHLTIANAAKRATLGYDEAATLSALARAHDPFRRARLDARGGHPSTLPVFIIGMPRSGSSLVEQILASHAEVHGAGEITDFERAARDVGGALAEAMDRPEAIEHASPDRIAGLGANYVARARALAPSARRVVNKMPGNFRIAGLIALALPNARLIHVRRDPRDVCLSCFGTLFARDMPFAYDLAELGRYHRAYEALMAGWREALPEGMMLEIRYEEVVADLEREARRVVAHCGLAWDPNCLDFHLGERSVRTASLAQVRRPLYGGSVGRWRGYAPMLGPLLDAL